MRRWLRRLFILLILGAIGVAGWRTRDSVPMAEVIPAKSRYRIVVRDLLEQRRVVLESSAIGAVLNTAGLDHLHDLLAIEPDFPPWVLNNVLGEQCIIYGDDSENFEDVVLVTKMYRLGPLLEQLHRFTPKVNRETLEGIALRRLSDDGPYYAVRGRNLLVAVAPQALVRALTLDSAHVEHAELESMLPGDQGETLRGITMLDRDHALGAVFESLGFAVRVDQEALHVQSRGRLQDDWEQKAAPLVRDQAPRILLAPPSGLVEISLNVGKNGKATLAAIGDAFGISLLDGKQWINWEMTPGLPQSTVALFNLLGPGVRLTWLGVDPYELVPTPRLIATLDGNQEAVMGVFSAVREQAQSADIEPSLQGMVFTENAATIDMPGGSSLAPTFVIDTGRVLLSSGTEALAHQSEVSEPLSEVGNLYVRARPGPLLNAIEELGTPYAEAHMLRGIDAATFANRLGEWRARTEAFESFEILLSIEGGIITTDLTLAVAAKSTDVK
jgi:hypothetical protein